jgi:hypothetical protein
LKKQERRPNYRNLRRSPCLSVPVTVSLIFGLTRIGLTRSKTPYSEAAIEAYAASIAAKGILQNLVVEPELDTEGAATGLYFVTIGEGRRHAQLLRLKRKEIKKTEPLRCIVDTANDPHEISLDENVTWENMHPADQFEAYLAVIDPNQSCSAVDFTTTTSAFRVSGIHNGYCEN